MRFTWLMLASGVLCWGGCATGKSATFDVRHELTVKVPEGAKHVRVWFCEPQRDAAQTVRDLKIDAPYPHRRVTDSEGNSYVYFDVSNPEPEWKVTETFSVTRKEVRSGAGPEKTRPYQKSDLDGMDKYLRSNTHVVVDDEMRKLAASIVGDETNPVRQARRIYDWVLGNIDYWVKHPDHLKASPVGSSEYCLMSRTGNCTDFHSLYASLARAAGIPTRITYGSLFKTPLNGVDQDQSYHCWIEFWAPNLGWVPLDVAVADIFVGDFDLDDANRPKVTLTTADGYSGPDPAKVDYYFGNLEARRVTWSRGRDLILTPRQAGGPVNAMPKAYVEIDGQQSSDYGRKLTYTER